MAVSCPIFIPGICEVFPQAYELFASIVANSPSKTDSFERLKPAQLYFGHSSLSSHMVKNAAQKTNGTLEEIAKLKVPLNINITDSTTSEHKVPIGKFIESLKPYGLEVNNQEYFHDLVVSRITYDK